MNDFEIQTVDDLREFFHIVKNPTINKKTIRDTCYVSSHIRKYWMLNHNRITINGRVYNIEFKDLKGGVWEASLQVNS